MASKVVSGSPDKRNGWVITEMNTEMRSGDPLMTVSVKLLDTEKSLTEEVANTQPITGRSTKNLFSTRSEHRRYWLEVLVDTDTGEVHLEEIVPDEDAMKLVSDRLEENYSIKIPESKYLKELTARKL